MIPVLTLAVTREPVHCEHVFLQHVDCRIERCHICDGGLSVCEVCGAFEGALLDSCPGVKLTIEQHEWNYKRYLKMRPK